MGRLPALIKKMVSAAGKAYYDKDTGLFLSGKNRQISYASQAWMVLSDVVSGEEAKKVLSALDVQSHVLRPGGPYLYHYVVEAYIKAGMNKQAKNLVQTYWGGMVKKGADTFWEVYDPENELLSPYGFFPVNSYCHAWSCTPVYFIRKYPEIFQD